MSPKLTPSNPSDLMTIRPLNPSITTLSLPFTRAGLVALGGRATLVKLTTGSLAVFSPVALTPEVRDTVSTMAAGTATADGPVSYIIAPDTEHHIFLSEWKNAYPSAKILAPEGLYEKRQKQASSGKSPNVTRDDPFHFIFRDANRSPNKIAPDFDADFETEYLPASPNKEIAFLHKPTKTLIQADLMFNLPPTEQYAKVPEAEKPKYGYFGLSKLGNLIFGAVGRTEGDLTWPRRFYWYVQGGKDRNAINESLRRIDGWDFENVIPCHGDTILGDGKERFRRVFEWHLKAKTE